jgi:hypothetical protein
VNERYSLTSVDTTENIIPKSKNENLEKFNALEKIEKMSPGNVEAKNMRRRVSVARRSSFDSEYIVHHRLKWFVYETFLIQI